MNIIFIYKKKFALRAIIGISEIEETAEFLRWNFKPKESVGSGEIRLLENGSAVTSHRLENDQDGTFRFELSFQESNEPSLAVSLQIDGEDYDIILGSVNHQEEDPGRPDADYLVELGKTMQWRMSIKADFAGYHNIPEVVSGFGKVLPDPLYFREISSPVDGHIDPRDLSILPASGTYIQAGERITAISPPLASDNSWIEQRLAFHQADEAYERAKRLIENDAISLGEYHQREREYEVRRAIMIA